MKAPSALEAVGIDREEVDAGAATIAGHQVHRRAPASVPLMHGLGMEPA